MDGNRGREGGRKEGCKKEAKRKWEKGEEEREVLAAQQKEKEAVVETTITFSGTLTGVRTTPNDQMPL